MRICKHPYCVKLVSLLVVRDKVLRVTHNNGALSLQSKHILGFGVERVTELVILPEFVVGLDEEFVERILNILEHSEEDGFVTVGHHELFDTLV